MADPTDDIVSRMSWWGAKRVPPKGMPTLPGDCREAAAELLHLREENARIRRETIEEAAKVADRAAAGASSEAKALRALKDYARAKQLDLESAACANLSAAIRALLPAEEEKR